MSDELAQLLDPDFVDQLHGNAVFGDMGMRQRPRNAGLFRVVLKQPVKVLPRNRDSRSPLGTSFSHSVIAGFSSSSGLPLSNSGCTVLSDPFKRRTVINPSAKFSAVRPQTSEARRP